MGRWDKNKSQRSTRIPMVKCHFLGDLFHESWPLWKLKGLNLSALVLPEISFLSQFNRKGRSGVGHGS
ncbi:hypothetical protein AB3S75_039339 [Citrus x aurantiifolia]